MVGDEVIAEVIKHEVIRFRPSSDVTDVFIKWGILDPETCTWTNALQCLRWKKEAQEMRGTDSVSEETNLAGTLISNSQPSQLVETIHFYV